MQINLDHSSDCICKSLGLDCEMLSRMEVEVTEAIERSDKMSEAMELSVGLGKSENEQAAYLIIFGRIWERKLHQKGHEVTGGITDVIAAIRKKMKDMQDGREPD